MVYTRELIFISPDPTPEISFDGTRNYEHHGYINIQEQIIVEIDESTTDWR